MTEKAGRTREYLTHMLLAVERIEEYTTGFTSVSFEADTRTQDAVIRNFEILGEAARNILRHDPSFVRTHPELPWAQAYQMRNALSHGYADVDIEIVWRTIQTRIPTLKTQLIGLLSP